ncbi:MAG: site-specific DNA-methyltransferase [Planctomycetaceae bacterium]|nr:site-specific DNA-methyltransferase [Planctomycetaceae bacterium]
MQKFKDILQKKSSFTFITGDALEVLQAMPSNIIHCVITSPPYWRLREYDNNDNIKEIGNESDYTQYVQKLTNIFNEVKRILTDEGSLWLNLGDKYYNKELMGMPWRVALSLMDSGWILRNDIIWDQMKGTQSSKDRLRDVYEHIFHFVKRKKYYYEHDEIRIRPIRKPKVYNGELVSATGVSGKKYKQQIENSTVLSEEEKTNARNALNEAIAEMGNGTIVDFRMTIRGEQRTYHSDNQNVSGRAKELATKGYFLLKMGANGHIPTDIWRIAPEDTWRKDTHYAVFPEELLLNPIRATCPIEGIVLDPFSGTGSTVYTAVELNRRGIGIDLSEHYNDIARKRMKEICKSLF